MLTCFQLNLGYLVPPWVFFLYLFYNRTFGGYMAQALFPLMISPYLTNIRL